MSVTTTADEKINKAKELISEAYSNLIDVLKEDTWGHNDFHDGYIEEISSIALELLKLKKRL